MRANDILDDQIIHIKRGRQNGFGFEPLWNSYFDFYLDSRYFEEPLLELEDVTFHLYLRKNLNDQNKNWKMPTIRQIMKKFRIGQKKVYAMLDRLERAHLLNKESGVRTGSVNERNVYILSDPIPTLTEFLEVAAEGFFGRSLLPTYVIDRPSNDEPPCIQDERGDVSETNTPCIQNEYNDVSETNTSPCIQNEYDQQTLKTKQTSGKQSVDPAFAELRASMPEKTFDQFLTGAKFLGVEDGVAVIGLLSGYAKDWIENRMANRIKQVFKAEAVRCVILTEIAWSPPGGGLVAPTLI